MHVGTTVSGSLFHLFYHVFACKNLNWFGVIRKYDYSIVILLENPPARQILVIFLDLLELRRNFRDQIVFLIVVASLLLPFANLLL